LGGIGPQLRAARGIERIQMRVAAAEVDDAVDDRRGGLDAHLVVDGGILAGLEAPALLAAGTVERVEVAVPAADVERARGESWRGVHHVAGRELPVQRAARRIERVDVAVAAAEV